MTIAETLVISGMTLFVGLVVGAYVGSDPQPPPPLPPPMLIVQLSADEWAAISENTKTGGIQEAIDGCTVLLEGKEYKLDAPLVIEGTPAAMNELVITSENPEATAIMVNP